MRPPPVYMSEYEIGDAVAFDAVEPISAARREAYATRRPAGEAFTARRAGDDAPVACMGFYPAEGHYRAWAIIARDVGISSWGHLLRMAKIVLEACPAQVLRAHACGGREARLLQSVGFVPSAGAAGWPLSMVRFR